ncbi:E3 ubiquitin-protein ligase ZNF598/Hel2 like protein, partial [Aduncisulcus paluster]
MPPRRFKIHKKVLIPQLHDVCHLESATEKVSSFSPSEQFQCAICCENRGFIALYDCCHPHVFVCHVCALSTFSKVNAHVCGVCREESSNILIVPYKYIPKYGEGLIKAPTIPEMQKFLRHSRDVETKKRSEEEAEWHKKHPKPEILDPDATPIEEYSPSFFPFRFEWMKHRKAHCMCTKESEEEITRLYSPCCRICGREFRTFMILTKHLSQSHHKTLCLTCINHHSILPYMLPLLTQSELKQHISRGLKDEFKEFGFRGHPRCSICSKLFYSDDELLHHLNTDHIVCSICQHNGDPLYFSSVHAMTAHITTDHFVCRFRECVERGRGLIAYGKRFELIKHILDTHAASLTSLEKKSLQLELGDSVMNDEEEEDRSVKQSSSSSSAKTILTPLSCCPQMSNEDILSIVCSGASEEEAERMVRDGLRRGRGRQQRARGPSSMTQPDSGEDEGEIPSISGSSEKKDKKKPSQYLEEQTAQQQAILDEIMIQQGKELADSGPIEEFPVLAPRFPASSLIQRIHIEEIKEEQREAARAQKYKGRGQSLDPWSEGFTPGVPSRSFSGQHVPVSTGGEDVDDLIISAAAFSLDAEVLKAFRDAREREMKDKYHKQKKKNEEKNVKKLKDQIEREAPIVKSQSQRRREKAEQRRQKELEEEQHLQEIKREAEV